ncbi:hypothetical protein R5R35_011836 [Gryllus longicercus]|uniref:Uncharacterized protein n=1 Tax=Gryllus longicercus TaxID=2509291 RepID=A0AAN9WBF7_9ORTH
MTSDSSPRTTRCPLRPRLEFRFCLAPGIIGEPLRNACRAAAVAAAQGLVGSGRRPRAEGRGGAERGGAGRSGAGPGGARRHPARRGRRAREARRGAEGRGSPLMAGGLAPPTGRPGAAAASPLASQVPAALRASSRRRRLGMRGGACPRRCSSHAPPPPAA